MEDKKGKSGGAPRESAEEMFDVRELVANDPDLPKGFSQRKRKKGPGKAPPPRNTRKTTSKKSIYLFLILGILFTLGVAVGGFFILVRYILPRGR